MWTTKRFGLMTAALVVLFGVFFEGSNSTTDPRQYKKEAEDLARFEEDVPEIEKWIKANKRDDPEGVAKTFYHFKEMKEIKANVETDAERAAARKAAMNSSVVQLKAEADAALKAIAKAVADAKAAAEAEAEAAAKSKEATKAHASAVKRTEAAAEAELLALEAKAVAAAKTKAATEAEAAAKAKATAKKESAVEAEANAKVEAKAAIDALAKKNAQEEKLFLCREKYGILGFEDFKKCMALPGDYGLCLPEFAPSVAYWNCEGV